MIFLFYAFFFASLPFSSHYIACLANVQRQICHSVYKECVEVDGTFVPALLWSVQAHFCWILPRLLCFYWKKRASVRFFPVGSFCSRSECERGKVIWDGCVAEINEDPGLMKDFDTQMLAVMDTAGQYTQTDWSILFCLIACLLRCISLALGANFVWKTPLPSGPSGDRSPFRFLECDVQGGDANQIQDVDAALAWISSQLPFVSGRNAPAYVVSLSWPRNMEMQDLYPLTSSTYTLPTGTIVDVPCVSRYKLVDVKQTECPDSFVNPNDPNYGRPCVKVLHGSTRCLHLQRVSLTPLALFYTRSFAQRQHTPTRSMEECGLEAILSDWSVWC